MAVFDSTIPSGTQCWYDSATQSVQCANTGGVTRPRIVTPSYNPNVKVTTPSVSSGLTTVDKVLAAILSGFAIQKGAAYVPTTTQPVQQQYYPQIDPNYPIGGGGTGASFGAGIEQFITQNTGLLLALGLGIVLFKSGRK